MKICLPTENWNDIFGCVPRPQLGQIVPQIGDWYFASKAQYYLHECGKITIGWLRILELVNGNGPVIFKTDGWGSRTTQELPFAHVPIPKNIKDFKISLYYIDQSILRFLREFHHNSLFTNVHLNLGFVRLDALLAFMRNILPLVTSINSINIRGIAVKDFPTAEKKMAITMLSSARILYANNHCLEDDFLFAWLYNPREDGKTRMLIHNPSGGDSTTNFIEQLKKDFLATKQAITFFIRLVPSWYTANIQYLTLKNTKTNEKLVIKEISSESVLISRCPMEANEEWIKEMTKEPVEEYRKLYFMK